MKNIVGSGAEVLCIRQAGMPHGLDIQCDAKGRVASLYCTTVEYLNDGRVALGIVANSQRHGQIDCGVDLEPLRTENESQSGGRARRRRIERHRILCNAEASIVRNLAREVAALPQSVR